MAWIMLVGALIAAGTLAMTIRNLARYLPAPAPGEDAGEGGLVCVCVPARNEERNIGACVGSLLANDYPAVEVLVYDDQSTDGTAALLRSLAAGAPRVRVVPTAPLPEGWNGKQHACWRMAQAACGGERPARWLLFTDADVRFSPDAIGRATALAERLGVGLLSTVPRQRTGTLGEALLVPLIHFILLSYLPMGRMRSTLDPASSAGCGQFLLVTAEAYSASGGHGAFKDSMHDGIMMPRALRRAGFRTDLFDGTDLASVRMYHGLGEAWRGFAKNAFEGLGSVALLLVLTVQHAIGHILPWVYLPIALGLTALGGGTDRVALVLAAIAVALALTQRLILAGRLRQPIVSALLHPLGVAMMTLIQWHSMILHQTGRRSWRGRGRTGVMVRGEAAGAPSQ